jgi:HAD superfamily hydrolase (TIGR01509 family)
VIFDLYGTLVDNFGGAFGDRLREAGILDDVSGGQADDFVRLWGSAESHRKRVRGDFASTQESIRAVCERIGSQPAPEILQQAAQIRSDYRWEGLQPRPGVIETLEALRRSGLKLGLMSSAEKDTVALWPRTSLARLFDAVAISAELHLLKPDPRFYKIMCERLGVPPQRCLYVGDGDGQELTGAIRAGMDAVLVCAPHEEHIVMAREEARNWRGPRIATIEELPPLILDGNGSAVANAGIALVAPSEFRREESIAYLEEYGAAGETWGQGLLEEARRDFVGLVRRIRQWENGIGAPPDGVPTSIFLLVRGPRILAECSLRHRLTDSLRKVGGHISYGVRPSERGKGYATHMLRLVLDEARSRGMTRVLITCDNDNVASARVIQKNGGVLESEGVDRTGGKLMQRYWIDLALGTGER